jgi:bacterioferritin
LPEFLTDVETLRRNAREHIEKGPITDAYAADLNRVLSVLNEALATELVCVLRYKRHYYMAEGLNSGPVAAEFLQYATEEQGHADLIAARIVQLQGEPDFNPDMRTARSHGEYEPGTGLLDMVTEDLVAERVAIASYGEKIKWLGTHDTTTRRMLEDILAVEEEHADDLLTFLKEFGPKASLPGRTIRARGQAAH